MDSMEEVRLRQEECDSDSGIEIPSSILWLWLPPETRHMAASRFGPLPTPPGEAETGDGQPELLLLLLSPLPLTVLFVHSFEMNNLGVIRPSKVPESGLGQTDEGD